LFLLGATSTALPIRTSNFTQAVSSKWFARVRIGKAVESGAVGGQAIAAGERSWSVLFLIKSKFHWSNFKEIYFAQNVTVTQKDKSTIFFSSVHCAYPASCATGGTQPDLLTCQRYTHIFCKEYLFRVTPQPHDDRCQ
jgi:hypothetical protein